MAPQKKQGFQAFRFQEAKPNQGAQGLQKPAGISKLQQQHQQKPLVSAPVSSAKDDAGVENPVEQLLRQFDLNSAFGPCIGMTRLARTIEASRNTRSNHTLCGCNKLYTVQHLDHYPILKNI
eukprot:scaffold28716_cov21-Tisochrysis_lutea.AAC.1